MISDLDLEKSKSNLLIQERQLKAAEGNALNNDMQIRTNENQINEINQTKSDNQSTKQLTLNEDIHRLLSAIQDWKKQFLIIAPIDGKVTFSKIQSSKQAVAAGDELLTIVPDNADQKIVCKATMPIANSGKVKTGLLTTIKLDNFPYQQYGILEGRVENISAVPQKENYLVEISVNNDLKTTYKKSLPFQQEMQGSANIITEDKRVIMRVFDRMNDLVKNKAE